MSQNLKNEISQLLTKKKCPFCHKKVSETNLAGLEHQKDFPFFLKNPICQDCWTKNPNLISSQYFSSLTEIKNTNQKLQNFIKNHKEKQKNQPKNPPKEEKIYEDWQKKLNNK